MPSYVHNVKIIATAASSAVVNGDSLLIAPTSSQKNHFGPGSLVTGDSGAVFTIFSKTATNDQDADDSTHKVGTGT